MKKTRLGWIREAADANAAITALDFARDIVTKCPVENAGYKRMQRIDRMLGDEQQRQLKRYDHAAQAAKDYP